MSLKLFVAEDESNLIRQYEKSVEKWNNDGKEAIEILTARDKGQAMEILESKDCDAAILDLMFPGDTPSHATGNVLLGIIKKQLRYPVYVVTGNPNELDGEFDDHPFIEVIVRGSIKNDDLLEKIFTRYSTGITKIMGKTGRLEKALKEVFWDHLSHAIPHWEKIDLSPDMKEKQLLRHALSHLQEVLAIDEAGQDEKYNTAEVYIKPPVRKSVTPGLVVEREGEKFVVITPACDVSQNKADFFQLLKLLEFEKLPDIQSKKRSNNRQNELKKYIKNKKERFHFLPRYDDLPASLIDFQDVTTIKSSELPQNCKHVCTITSPFFKDIVNRYSAYYARQGSPDFTDTDTLSKQLNEQLPEPEIVQR
ncbi:MAG: hypothetical protein OXC41_02225 [Gammaproteobacteria bacterium]|nr:hypothetical protein [Gammaproteobacteria bacterium]